MIIDRLLSRYFRHSSRRYMTFSDARTRIQLPAPQSGRKYLLYLHIPFCVVLCPFCSFHRVQYREDRATQYFRALRKEIRLATQQGFEFGELYVGGGTPTVLPGELIETVKLIRELHPLSRVSAETNPDDLDDERLPLLHDAGVSRLSVGVQSFDDNLLKEMQRYDKYGSGRQIRARIKKVEGLFDTLNVDMIFNFPHQTEDSLRRDLMILSDELGADQVSFYPLMSANSTRKAMRREIGDVDFSRERALYEMIAGHMLAAGYKRSSAWCFSRVPAMIDEYITEHDEYLGLGSGAFSYVDGSLYASTFSINHYLRLANDGRSGIVRRSSLPRREQMRYHLLMQLFGGSLDLATANRFFANGFRRSLWPELLGLRLIGAVRKSGNELHLTERGQYLWVMLMREFFTGVNNYRDEMRQGIARELTVMEAG